MYFENMLQKYACLGVGWGQGRSVFLSTGVGGGFQNDRFWAYVLYGWPLWLKLNLEKETQNAMQNPGSSKIF